MSSFLYTFFLKPFKPWPKKGSQEKFFVYVFGFTGQCRQKIKFKTDVIGGFGIISQIIAPFTIKISGFFGSSTIEATISVKIDRSIRRHGCSGGGVDEQPGVFGAQVVEKVNGLCAPLAE